MKRLFILGALLSLLVACDPQDNYIDTGKSIRHDCSMYEYFKTNSYNWDSLILMVQQANMVELFDGKDVNYPDVTFFGIKNHSIRRYMLENDIERVKDIPQATCRELLLKHLVDKRIMKEEVAFNVPDISGKKTGTEVTCLGGNVLLLYLEQEDYSGVENAGAIHLSVISLTLQVQIPMASPNIGLTNGVIHALNYNYDLGQNLK